MTIQHTKVQSGDGWLSVASRLIGDGATPTQINTLATKIAVANGNTQATALYVDRILHYDDIWVPTVTLPPPTPTPTGFYIKNGKIGKDGRVFVPIGVNGVASPRGASGWWNDQGMGTMQGPMPGSTKRKAVRYKELGFTAVRLNFWFDSSSGYSDRQFLDGICDVIDEYTAQGIVCIPAYHGLGPGSNPSVAFLTGNAAVQSFWSEMATKYASNPLVWVNPLNEPIGTPWDSWEAVGNYQYDRLRALGFTGIIVIDLPQWAQGINVGLSRMTAFMAGKTKCVLGFHNYDMGDQAPAITAAQAAGVPIIIGEYGETLSGGNRTSALWCAANADTLGIGALGWWGAGNRNDNYVLRNAVGSTWYEESLALTDYGQRLFALGANRPVQPVL